MAKNETMIGQLYRLYANRFPEEKTFFLGIASEEDNHHAWIENISKQATELQSTLKLDTFTPSAVKAYQN
jgi:rubrerythrin